MSSTDQDTTGMQNTTDTVTYWGGLAPYSPSPCPSCGYCPSCGRGRHYYPYPTYQPYWQTPVLCTTQG